MPKITRNLIIYVLIFGVVIALGYMMCSPQEVKDSNPSDILELFREHGGYISVEDMTLKAEIDGDQYEADVTEDFDPHQFIPDDIGDGTLQIGYTDEDSSTGGWSNVIFTVLPIILLVVLVVFMLRRFQRRPSA